LIYFRFIPFTRRVKGYNSFVGKHVIGRWERFRPYKVGTKYVYVLDLATSVCLSVRMNAEISKTLKARNWGADS